MIHLQGTPKGPVQIFYMPQTLQSSLDLPNHTNQVTKQIAGQSGPAVRYSFVLRHLLWSLSEWGRVACPNNVYASSRIRRGPLEEVPFSWWQNRQDAAVYPSPTKEYCNIPQTTGLIDI